MKAGTRGKAVPSSGPRRLQPQQRQAEILQAALRLLARNGLEGFSLEAVAREAGVAASLPRHYFGGVSGLLKAATADVLGEVEQLLLLREGAPRLEERIRLYLDVLTRHPWAHRVWMRAGEVHAEIGAAVRKARRRMAENIYGAPWADLSVRDQLEAQGRIGHVEAIVADWLQRRMANRGIVVDVLVSTMREWATQARERRTTSSANPGVGVAGPVAA